MRTSGLLWVAIEAAVALAADVVEVAVVVVVVEEEEEEEEEEEGGEDAVDEETLEAIDAEKRAD
jgi:hypothetical protein